MGQAQVAGALFTRPKLQSSEGLGFCISYVFHTLEPSRPTKCLGQAQAAAAKERRDYVHRPLRHPDFANCNQQDAVEKIIPRDKRSFLIRPHKADPCRLVLTLMVRAWGCFVHVVHVSCPGFGIQGRVLLYVTGALESAAQKLGAWCLGHGDRLLVCWGLRMATSLQHVLSCL